jgi:hypothetical protein
MPEMKIARSPVRAISATVIRGSSWAQWLFSILSDRTLTMQTGCCGAAEHAEPMDVSRYWLLGSVSL